MPAGRRPSPWVPWLAAPALGLLLAASCAAPPERAARPETPPPVTAGPTRADPAASRAWLSDVTGSLGLPDAVTWPAGTYFLPEIMSGGVAVLDLDDDGALDVLHVRSPPPGLPDAPSPNGVFRQQADGTFRDVGASSGLADPGFGQGVAVGDVDGDGDVDVYFANYGPDTFHLNEGGGTFREATREAGLEHDAWSTSAAFFDLDRDGDLDLHVAHYVDYVETLECFGPDGAREYCGPDKFEPQLDSLFLNDGTGRFREATAELGIDAPGAGLGVVAADFTGDGLVDVYVANDMMANHLWVQQPDGRLVDEAVLRGVAFNARGEAEASMGIAVGDLDENGALDLFMTHLVNQTNTLYLAGRRGLFRDDSDASGMGRVDVPFTGFGCAFVDFDHDGDLDVAVANGRVSRGPSSSSGQGFWSRYAEPNLLFENRGGARFDDVSRLAGAFGAIADVSRGLAFGDLDRDGDLDLVLGNLRGLRVFRNEAPAPGTHWLQVRCSSGRTLAHGAVVTVVAGERRWVRVAQPGQSYASSCDPTAHVGLGAVTSVDAIEVAWPDGVVEVFDAPGVDRRLTLVQGAGRMR